MSIHLTLPPDQPLPDPTADLLRRVGRILLALSSLIFRFLLNTRHASLHMPLLTYLGRVRNRIARAAAHLAAGTTPRPPRALRSSRSGPPPVRFPSTRGWLIAPFAHHGAYYTALFENLLHEPFAIAFFAANPAVARILRPLWHMLAVHPLLLPPRPPRRPRKTAPAPAPIPAPQPPPSAASPAPRRRQLPRLVLDAITPAPNLLKKPA